MTVTPLRVTSNFGKRNTGIKGASTYHKGIDLGRDFNKQQTFIYAVAEGKIEKNYWHDTRGWVVVIKHYGFQTLYQHLKEQSKLSIGEDIKEGQKIGIMGATTKTIKNMGEHLHFELTVDGNNIDPLPYLERVKEKKDLDRDEVTQLIKDILNSSIAHGNK